MKRIPVQFFAVAIAGVLALAGLAVSISAVQPEAAGETADVAAPSTDGSATSGETISAAASGMQTVEFFVGRWNIEVRTPDGGTVIGRARTHVRPILDGTALQSDYYGLNPAGRTVFRGTTIRTFVPATGRFAVHWAMAGQPGYTYLDEEYRDGELHAEGGGFDDQGTFRERYRYYDISEASYTFTISRSYDDGETWKPWVLIEAERAEPASPSDAGPAD